MLGLGLWGVWHWHVLHLSQSPRVTVVELTDSGFLPSHISVDVGQTVRFVNKSSHDFWPASDLHPTHTLYPEFDAHAPIGTNGEWAFVFTRVGEWHYHDHLSPSMRGVVVVGGLSGSSETKECSVVADKSEKQACWNRVIISLLNTKGVAAALQYISMAYTQDSVFATDCHDYLHKVGEAVYDQHIPLTSELGPETNFCGYGFFHGYMERLLTVSGDITEASVFCEKVSTVAAQVTADACLHGFGHGLFASAVEKGGGNLLPESVVATALVGCEKLGGGQTEKAARCSSGVYMELGTDEGAGQYNLHINATDPLGICMIQPTIYKADCYRQMQVVILNIANGNIRKGLEYSERMPDADFAATSVETYMGGATKLGQDGVKDATASCRNIVAKFQPACISGIALAHMLRGAPGKEAVQALEYCNGDLLTKTEGMACRSYVIRYARNAYNPSVLQTICASLPASEQSECK